VAALRDGAVHGHPIIGRLRSNPLYGEAESYRRSRMVHRRLQRPQTSHTCPPATDNCRTRVARQDGHCCTSGFMWSLVIGRSGSGATCPSVDRTREEPPCSREHELEVCFQAFVVRRMALLVLRGLAQPCSRFEQ
jgi:hypothetical protein